MPTIKAECKTCHGKGCVECNDSGYTIIKYKRFTGRKTSKPRYQTFSLCANGHWIILSNHNNDKLGEITYQEKIGEHVADFGGRILISANRLGEIARFMKLQNKKRKGGQ